MPPDDPEGVFRVGEKYCAGDAEVY